jgi:hypothetical protein
MHIQDDENDNQTDGNVIQALHYAYEAHRYI